jgi:SAM-dependent methyltransferase
MTRAEPVPGPFRESSAYYLRGRPAYSAELLPTLRRELGLDGSGALLDVGCGPGIVVVELAPAFERATALDPEPGMLAVARQRAASMGVDVEWIAAAAEDIAALGLGPFRLVTFGQSFHWTEGLPVLSAVHEALEPGGAVALIGHRAEGRPIPPEPHPGHPSIPEDEVKALIARYVGDDSLVPTANRSTPFLHADVMRASPFGECRIVYAPGRVDIVRDIDSVVAGYYSTSFAAPRLFGERKDEFESALRALLLRDAQDGLFWDWPGDTEILIAQK